MSCVKTAESIVCTPNDPIGRAKLRLRRQVRWWEIIETAAPNNAKVIFFALIALQPGRAGETNVWTAWEKELNRQCPKNHVDWIMDGGYDDLPGDFQHTLPISTQRRVSAIADYSRRCSEVTIGFQCEMDIHLEAFNKLSLLKQFTAFECRRYKCDDPALCTRVEP